MFTINLYKLRKRSNSTKIPTPEDGIFPCTGQLNTECGILRPHVRIQFAPGESPAGYNYAYIAEFGRYYNVAEWTNVKGVWEGDFVVDPLSSWRQEIFNQEEYVLRAASEYDGDVVDTTYPLIAKQKQDLRQCADWPWTTEVGGGSYVIGVINGDTQGTGAVSYYVFTRKALQDLQKALFENADWITSDWVDIQEDVFKAIFNPMQYMTSCMYFPFEMTGITPILQVPFGWWTLPIITPGWHISPLEYIEHTFTIPVPKHPEAGSRGNYLNLEPYSRYALDIWPWGRIHLDSLSLCGCETLQGKIRTDLVTGQGTLFLASEFVPPDGGANFVLQTAQVGSPVQLAQLGTNWLNYAANAVAPVSELGAAISEGVGAGIGGLLAGSDATNQRYSAARAAGQNIAPSQRMTASGIASAAASIAPMLETGGTNGSKACLGIKPRLYAQFNYTAPEDRPNRGRPLMKVKTLGDLEGFVLCADADISIAGTKEENEAIKATLCSGIFLE